MEGPHRVNNPFHRTKFHPTRVNRWTVHIRNLSREMEKWWPEWLSQVLLHFYLLTHLWRFHEITGAVGFCCNRKEGNSESNSVSSAACLCLLGAQSVLSSAVVVKPIFFFLIWNYLMLWGWCVDDYTYLFCHANSSNQLVYSLSSKLFYFQKTAAVTLIIWVQINDTRHHLFHVCQHLKQSQHHNSLRRKCKRTHFLHIWPSSSQFRLHSSRVTDFSCDKM